MRVVICSIHSKYVHSALAPWCLKAGISRFAKTPAETVIYETTIHRQPQALLADLAQTKPDLLCFSTYIWNITLVEEMLARLPACFPHLPVVLGGPEASFRAKELLDAYPGVTYVLAGEGEWSLPALIDALQGRGNLAQVTGLSYRQDDGRVIVQKAKELRENPPSPYDEEYLARLQGRIAYLETSRGCPFSCAFCLSGRREKARFFPLERAKREILLLADSGTRTIKFVDRTFNCERQRAYEILAFILAQKRRGRIGEVCFHFEVAADLFDDRTLALVREAPPGLFQFEAGLQSFHAPTLDEVARTTDLDRLVNNLKALIAPHNCHVHLDLIAGLPYEDFSAFRDSFDRAYALAPHMLQLGFLKLLPGSRLYRDAARYGYLAQPQAPYTIMKSAWIGPEELCRLRAAEDALERLYNSGRFYCTLAYVEKAAGVRPYDLFEGMGKYAEQMGGTYQVSLDTYTGWVYDYFSSLVGVEPARLRDEMVCDRIAVDNTRNIPPCLRAADARLGKIARQVYQMAAYRDNKGIKPAVALLNTKNQVAVADYRHKDVISGRYQLAFYPLTAFSPSAGFGEQSGEMAQGGSTHG